MFWRRQPQHRVLMVTEDYQLRDIGLNVDSGSVFENRSGRAWGLVPGAVIPQFGTHKPYMLLCPRCDGPFNVRRNRWEVFDEAEVARIAEQCSDKQIAELPRLALQEWGQSLMRIAVLGLVGAIAMLGAVIAVSSGMVPGL